VACHLEEKRHGAFRRLKVGPFNPLRAIASVAVPRVVSAGAATTSAVPSVGVVVSAEAMVSVAAEVTVVAEGTAIGK